VLQSKLGTKCQDLHERKKKKNQVRRMLEDTAIDASLQEKGTSSFCTLLLAGNQLNCL
jgi:hypothetical protein